MVSNFINPLIYFIICLSLGQVKNDDHCVSVLKVAGRYCIKSFLSCRIPDLEDAGFIIRSLKLVSYLRKSNGIQLFWIELVVDISIYQ